MTIKKITYEIGIDISNCNSSLDFEITIPNYSFLSQKTGLEKFNTLDEAKQSLVPEGIEDVYDWKTCIDMHLECGKLELVKSLYIKACALSFEKPIKKNRNYVHNIK